MREGICKSDRACVRLSYAFLEHKGCFNEQAGTELGVTPGFSNSSVTELPGKSPGCDLHGKRSMFRAEFDFHGKPGPDCSRSAGTGASAGPSGTRCWGAELSSSSSRVARLCPSHPRAHILSLGSRVQRWGLVSGTFGRRGCEGADAARPRAEAPAAA